MLKSLVVLLIAGVGATLIAALVGGALFVSFGPSSECSGPVPVGCGQPKCVNGQWVDGGLTFD